MEERTRRLRKFLLRRYDNIGGSRKTLLRLGKWLIIGNLRVCVSRL